MMELDMQLKELISKTWFRWTALIPGSIITTFIAQFPIHWAVLLINLFGKSDDDSGSNSPLGLYYWLAKIEPEKLELLFNAFFAPLILISMSAFIAPKLKLVVAIIVALALFVFDLYACMMFIGNIEEGTNEDFEWMRIFVSLLLAIIGIAVGLRNAYKLNKEQKIN